MGVPIQYRYSTMPRKGYENISVPSNIHAALEEIVKAPGSLYVSVSDLAKDALRAKIEKIRSQNPKWTEE
jgi:Arc/MetJ-type ribon-helix-helix transcriptional regulator